MWINVVTHRAREAGVPVFFIQHESNAGYLEHGSREWQLASGLQVDAGDRKIRKTTPDLFLRTDLHEALHALGVTRLVVCASQRHAHQHLQFRPQGHGHDAQRGLL